MSNPFQEHANNLSDYQQMLQGDDGAGGATMTVAGVEIACTASNVVTDFDLIPGGKSPKTFIENVEFLAGDLPAGYIPKKGNFFSLKQNPSSPSLSLMFWHGGLHQGGLIYSFMAFDSNYKA